MPTAGLGTWLCTEGEAEAMMDSALEAGIRLIDNSILYENEAAIGSTLKKWFESGIPAF
jgi:diketogulonate reductase-like aldo/keto reductase